MSRRSLPVAPALALASLLAFGSSGHAQGFQWPDEPENLEVLPDSIDGQGLREVMTGFTDALGVRYLARDDYDPAQAVAVHEMLLRQREASGGGGLPSWLATHPEDISSQELRQVMTSFTDALGVRCSHCHVGEEGADLTEYDFPADDKEPKQTARIMLRMVQDINSRHLGKLDHDVRADRVTCVTCHRGAEEPYLIQNVMAQVIERAGVDSAVARYRQLRERYYGGFTYDFRVGPLSELARNLATRGQTDAAVRMAELEVEYHPESYRAHFVLAQMRQQAGDRQGALESMKRALDLAPEDARPFLQRQLERIRGG